MSPLTIHTAILIIKQTNAKSMAVDTILQSFICFHFDIMFLLNCLQMILLPTDLLMDGTKPKQEQTEWMLFFS